MNQTPNESEVLLQEIIDALPENIVILDHQGKIVQVNKNCRELYSQYNQNLQIGENLLDFLDRKTNPIFHKIAEEIRSISQTAKSFFQIKFPLFIQNRQFWFNLRATKLANHQNLRIMLNLEDISISKFTEIALQESEQIYRTLAETASDAIIKMDESHNILFINQAAEKIFGLNPFEIIGQPLSILIPDQTENAEQPDIFHYFRTVEKNTNRREIEVAAKHKNGNVFPLEILLDEYQLNGNRYFICVGRDISHKKRIENANALLASIVESSDDAIISKNLKGIITSWNKSAENLFGYAADEVIGKPVTILIPPFLIDEETKILSKIKKGEKIEHFETLRQSKNGSLLNISLTISPIKDKNKKIIGASKIARDITEKHKAAEELKHSQLMLSLAMQSSRMGVWELDVSTGIVHWSKELEEIFGLAPGTFGNSRDSFYKLIHDDDHQRMWAEVQTAISEKRDYTIEFRFLHSDGSVRWMEGRGKAVYSEKGDPVRVYGIGIDITERKLAESNLRESEERYRTLFNSIDEGFCILEMIFNERNEPIDYRFIEINPMFEKLTGLKNANGKTARELVPDLEPHWFEIYGKVALTGEATRFTNGSAALNRWFDVYAIRLGDENSRRVALIFTNITERKLIELEREEILRRETEARKSAEETNRAKDDFLSVLSHELRTPLNAILGWTRILAMSSIDEERKLKAAETIERNARLQKNLIEDLLDVSRIISGKMRIEKEETDFVTIVNSALETVRPAADAKHIEIEFLTEIDRQTILGDATRLQQIIVNLINNAVKFTGENGNVMLYLSKNDDQLCLQITDNGIGISAEFLPFIFDRFRQADSTIIRNHSGLGLGLTIVRHLTELHGGIVKAESKGAGKGSTFTLTFPLPESTGTDSTNTEATYQQAFIDTFLKDRKILLVDDDCDGIEPVQMLLEKYGAETICVDSARAALDALTKEDFDLIISDIGMPEVDGFNLIRQIRALENTKEFPAIALTAYAGAEDRQKALSAGFQYHLAKPVDFEILLKTVSAIFKNEPQI